MVFPLNFWLLFGICMLVSAIGFKNYVWFISLGYGFSIAAQGAAMLILYGQNLTLGTITACVVFVLYGLRLGGYLAIREFGKSSYKKNNAKKINPRRFVDTGLYRIVRCPNYLGEMIFWTGVLISGIGAVTGWQWLVVAIGYIGIIFVMFSGARRLEIRQDKNYGNDPEYQKYVTTVPILLPLIPLYSVKKHKWLVA